MEINIDARLGDQSHHSSMSRAEALKLKRNEKVRTQDPSFTLPVRVFQRKQERDAVAKEVAHVSLASNVIVGRDGRVVVMWGNRGEALLINKQSKGSCHKDTEDTGYCGPR